jgi:hypothetical protein
VIDRLGHPFAHVAAAAIPQLVGFVGAGAGTARHDRPTAGTTFEQHFRFNGGIAAGIEHLPGHDGVNHEVKGIEHVPPIKDLRIL